MKAKFWKNTYALYFICCMSFISITLIIIGIIITIKYISLWPIILVGIIILFSCLYALFFKKKLLSQIILTNEGLECIMLKKQTLYIKWEEIINVKETPYSFTSSYLTFITYDKSIDIVLTKKIYNTIMEICPNQNLKALINNLESFKWFHKDK